VFAQRQGCFHPDFERGATEVDEVVEQPQLRFLELAKRADGCQAGRQRRFAVPRNLVGRGIQAFQSPGADQLQGRHRHRRIGQKLRSHPPATRGCCGTSPISLEGSL